MNARTMLTGCSLSFCIGDICRGLVQPAQVICVITMTHIENDEQFAEVVADYQRTYWRKYPEQAAAVAWELWKSGRIDQPRLRDQEDFHPGFNDPDALNGAPSQNWYVGEVVLKSNAQSFFAEFTC